jgi:hypothetical protein
MLALARNGYTDQEIKDALHGKYGARNVKFTYKLLDKNNITKGTLTNVIKGGVKYASFNDIKRTATFSIVDDGSINFLSDRIQPVMSLKMPLKYDVSTTNVALGKTVTTGALPGELNTAPHNDLTIVTNGITNNLNEYLGISRPPGNTYQYVKVDLGAVYNITQLKIWHYYSSPRLYTSKLEVSEDGVNWTTIFDSTINGLYAETSNGKTHNFKPLKVRYIKDSLFGSDVNTSNHWLEIQAFEAINYNSWIDFPLGVFLLATPKRMDEENAVKRDIEAYDGLLILIDDKLQSTYTINAGTNYKQAIIDLLATAGITQYIIEDTTKTLPITMAFDPGTSKLSVINSLINQINFTPIRVDVYGNFVTNSYIAPSSRGIEYTYADDSLSVTYKGMTESLDLFNIPNNWVVVATNAETAPLKSTYTNSNASSITSTVSRGRTITDYREIDNIADQQSLDSYTLRIANEASQIYGYLEFETAIMPQHDFLDKYKIIYSNLGINDDYIETEWSFDLEVGAKMKHVARRIVNI